VACNYRGRRLGEVKAAVPANATFQPNGSLRRLGRIVEEQLVAVRILHGQHIVPTAVLDQSPAGFELALNASSAATAAPCVSGVDVQEMKIRPSAGRRREP
jgi:hypothetical protein